MKKNTYIFLILLVIIILFGCTKNSSKLIIDDTDTNNYEIITRFIEENNNKEQNNDTDILIEYKYKKIISYNYDFICYYIYERENNIFKSDYARETRCYYKFDGGQNHYQQPVYSSDYDSYYFNDYDKFIKNYIDDDDRKIYSNRSYAGDGDYYIESIASEYNFYIRIFNYEDGETDWVTTRPSDKKIGFIYEGYVLVDTRYR